MAAPKKPEGRRALFPNRGDGRQEDMRHILETANPETARAILEMAARTQAARARQQARRATRQRVLEGIARGE
jgi:hypothetical protein